MHRKIHVFAPAVSTNYSRLSIFFGCRYPRTAESAIIVPHKDKDSSHAREVLQQQKNFSLSVTHHYESDGTFFLFVFGDYVFFRLLIFFAPQAFLPSNGVSGIS